LPLRSIDDVLAAHNETLLALPGVVGTAIGVSDGVACIRVLLADSSAATRQEIPEILDGYPVRAEFTGPIRAR